MKYNCLKCDWAYESSFLNTDDMSVIFDHEKKHATTT